MFGQGGANNAMADKKHPQQLSPHSGQGGFLSSMNKDGKKDSDKDKKKQAMLAAFKKGQEKK